jgi:uncharacterized membrane protein
MVQCIAHLAAMSRTAGSSDSDEQAHPWTRGFLRSPLDFYAGSRLAQSCRRAPGTRAWQGLYAIASLIGFYLIVAGYGASRLSTEIVYVTPPSFRYVAAILMLPAFTLALASVLPGRIRVRVGHPLVLATMLWAAAHLLTNGGVADLLLFGTFLVWSIAVRISLGRRPPRRPIALPSSAMNDAISVVAGLALYAIFIAWLHARLFGAPPLVW